MVLKRIFSILIILPQLTFFACAQGPSCDPNYSKQSDYPDENFAEKLKQSLEQAAKMGARRIIDNNWGTQPIRLRLASWLS